MKGGINIHRIKERGLIPQIRLRLKSAREGLWFDTAGHVGRVLSGESKIPFHLAIRAWRACKFRSRGGAHNARSHSELFCSLPIFI